MWLMDEEAYFEKVKNWNLREDYQKDLDVISLLTNYCLSQNVNKDLYLIGTGLGSDIDSITKYKKLNSIIGIEPIEKFYENALPKYQQLGASLLNITLEELSSKNHELSGIFVFSHSINHINEAELRKLGYM